MRSIISRWYEKYKNRIVNTDYGIGLKMPDDTIRPLGHHGIEVGKAFPNRYFFCTESNVVYFSDMTFIEKDIAAIMAPAGKDHRSDPDVIRVANNKFIELFDMRIASDGEFWPYYPIWINLQNDINRLAMVIGYFDSKHRRHGRWQDVETEITKRERWFFHGEEVTEDEYYLRGGYDLDISLPWNPAYAQSFVGRIE